MEYNKNIDFTTDELYAMLRKKEEEEKTRAYVNQNDDTGDHESVYERQHKQRRSWKKIFWTIILLLAIAFLLYLTLYRLGMAGKSFYRGDMMTGLALASPEVAGLTRALVFGF